MADTKFRGNWSPVIKNPTVHHFFPTAPVAKPKPKEVKKEEKKQVKKKEEKKEEKLQTEAPSDADVLFNIRDRFNNWRGYISSTGSCYNNLGQIIGYIEGDDAGSVDMDYLGSVNDDWQLHDNNDDLVAKIDPGKAYVLTPDGDIVVEMDNSGCIKAGENLTYLGQFEGFSYHDMKIIGLYVAFIDPSMIMPEGE